MIRPGPGGCTIRLQIDEIDTADSLQAAEDIWLPALEALQRLVNPGSLPEAGTKAVRDQIIPNGLGLSFRVRPDAAPRGHGGVRGCHRGLLRVS
jgi:hypothetical protein